MHYRTDTCYQYSIVVRVRSCTTGSCKHWHGCAMLKLKGVHLRHQPKRRCPEVRQSSAAGRWQLCPSVTAWRQASSPAARETAALEHFVLASNRPHRTCQICQEAIRARLWRRSLQARHAAPEEDTHSTPGSGVYPTPTSAHLVPEASATPAFAPADSSVWSPRSSSVSNSAGMCGIVL